MSLNDPVTKLPPVTAPFKRALGKPVPAEGEDGLFTQSWWPICYSSAASEHFVRGYDFLDGRVIVFRDKDGKAHVNSAFCPHLGADLSVGDMVDGAVRCVFHHWKYGADGRCVGMPSTDPIPPTARLFKFPTIEKYGLIWAFNGTEPHYDLPDFIYPDDELVYKIKIFPEALPVDPWIVCANTPDMQHIRYLHGININGGNPHDIVEWTDHSMLYEFEGTHTTGEPVSHKIGIIGTSMYFQETVFDGRWFGFVAPFGMPRPQQTLAFMAVCARKDMGTPEEIDAFLDYIIDLETNVVMEDLTNMQTIHFTPGTLTASDRTLARFFDYMRDFPRAHPSAEFIR
ncbi:aromatic ring-hydroxylating oxygenase subunit alpha [Govanella unica]|uniref:Rieske 2Fe-2S domain-containing protein n=1 Tax=Govanella unica TaxID=2975056 RepID=A0A9X3Z7U0_9PROT|nr:Rieske 2Fe-2S domain-containing protein [Govania unica]MDA5194537.1 Rieske 2Fe-2S domain-containing protein [Govania unica]